MKTSSGANERARPSLVSLADLYFRIGTKTFGSGSTTVVLLSREITARNWLAQWQTDLFYALARVAPGTNVLAFVATSAHAMRGWAGAITAILSLSIPASIVVVLLTLAYQRWNEHPAGGAFISAAMASIVGIVAGAAWLLSWPRFVRGMRVRTFALVIGAAALSFFLPPLPILAIGAIAGWLWPERS